MKKEYTNEDIEDAIEEAYYNGARNGNIVFKYCLHSMVSIPALAVGIMWFLNHFKIKYISNEDIIGMCGYTALGAFIVCTPTLLLDLSRILGIKPKEKQKRRRWRDPFSRPID